MNKKESLLVSFEQAKRLKKLGFDWECSGYYWPNGKLEKMLITMENHNDFLDLYSAPTLALALEWVRDEKDIVCEIFSQIKHFRLEYRWRYRLNYKETKSGKVFPDYEAAESALLNELLTRLEAA